MVQDPIHRGDPAGTARAQEPSKHWLGLDLEAYSDSSPSISQLSEAAVANHSCQNIIYQLLKNA